jgi:hypothetical protein
MAVFLADPVPTLNGRRNMTTCSVTGCRYGSSGFGLCTRHRSAWTRDGQPDPDGWAARAGLLGPPDPAECLLPFCTLWTENARQLYCKAHATRWAQLGRPDSADYLTHCLQRGKARIDFRGLAPQLKLELQYAVQCRHDQATIITAPAVVAWTIRLATGAGVTSLLDRTPQEWRELAGPKEGSYQRFLVFARDVVETLHEGTGWDVEYPRDIWRLHRLPGLTASPGKPTLPTPPPPARPEEPAIRKSWYRPADHACATARHPAAFQGNHVDDHAKSPIHGLRLRCAMYLATLSLIARQHA